MLPGNGNTAFDITRVLDPGGWYGALLGGMFNINGDPTWLEVVAWVAYMVPVLVIFLRPPFQGIGDQPNGWSWRRVRHSTPETPL